MQNIYLLISLFVLSLRPPGQAQTTAGCNCAVTISQSGTFDNNTLKVKPGQTVCVRSGTYTGLSFKNFVGTAAQPIRFVNCGGPVTTGAETSGGALGFINSSYFVLSGSGDSTVRYGFVATKCKGGASTVTVSGNSTNYEVSGVEVTGSGYAGFSMKLDPGCDSMSYQPNYTVRSVKLHDNYIHDTPGPGMFLGSGYSATNGTLITCNGVQKRVYPVQTEGLEVYNNRIEYINSAALNVYNAPGASIHDNSIKYDNLGSIPAGWHVGGSSACGCDYTVTQSGSYNNNQLRVPAGKTVCIQAGAYNNLWFNNFVGSPTEPIHFVNCGGLVTVGSPSNYSCFQFSGSRYFTVSGSGDPLHEYGIKVASSTTGAALNISDLSSDCDVHHVEVAESGFAGIMIKTDPTCNPATWRANFAMYNVNIHNNYVHDTKGEGIYAGSSFFGEGMTVTCNGVAQPVYPHLIYGLTIHHNRIERTGAEGLQYACAPDALVHHNTLRNTGLMPFAAGQNSGLQIGGGAGGDCYSNTIQQVAGMGIIIIGQLGNNRVFNNVINQVGGDGIFCDDRPGSLSGTFVQLVNNTINGTGRDGIRLYNQNNTNTIANNAISNWGSQSGRPFVFAQGATATLATNYTATANQTAGYRDVAAGDFSLLPTSPLINAGTNAAGWGVITDQRDQPRPAGSAYDIGAYEYTASGAASARVASRDEWLLNPLPDDSDAIIYPSPCYDQLIVRLPAGYLINQLDVYSATGQLMSSITLNDAREQIVLPTQTWIPGVYVCQIRTSQRVFRGRVLKL